MFASSKIFSAVITAYVGAGRARRFISPSMTKSSASHSPDLRFQKA